MQIKIKRLELSLIFKMISNNHLKNHKIKKQIQTEKFNKKD